MSMIWILVPVALGGSMVALAIKRTSKFDVRCTEKH